MKIFRGMAEDDYLRARVLQVAIASAISELEIWHRRYNLGLSSIVELSQAQLQQTQAQIGIAQAGYDYRLSLAILRYQTTSM